MVSSSILAAWALSYAALTAASPTPRALSPYAPVPATCPSTQLVRKASGVSAAEAAYIKQRYQKASQALESWLKSVDESFECGQGGWGNGGGNGNYGGKAPVVALTSSGGGYRAMLAGGGVIKGFDAREAKTTGVSGVYQALTYEAGLSGGSWLLSSIAGNGYPTISSLQTNLWETALQDSLLVPEILLSSAAAPIYSAVEADIKAKTAAGFQPTIIDPWGRILSYALLYGTDGGAKDTMSGIAHSSNFTAYSAPYPVITALGSDLNIDGVCIPLPNATQYEFHPYEFGSWDAGVDAFVSTEYLGTSFSGGKPASDICITHYDQLGYVLGTSSNVFGAICSAIPAANTTAASSLALVEDFAELVAPGQPGVPEMDLFGLYPNPFYKFPSSSLVSAQKTLELVDGGVGIGYQGNPIWPFLHRDVDVIIVNDNSADTVDNYPDGTEIFHTYEAAVAAGLTRMPVIPPNTTFVAEHLNQKPTFFGCNTDETATIIFIPNFNYTFPSGEPTAKIQYYKNETDGMIANGVVTANYGGKADWPLCLGCGIMKKSGEKLPAGCAACFKEYCYN
jgi:lysophospholipase